MLSAVGRNSEREELRSILQTTRALGVAAVVEIEGSPGIGKTTFAATVAGDAKAAGWIVGSIACHAMQSTIPGAALRRLIEAIAQSLGSQATRYATPATASPEESLLRLLEGVLLDHPLLISIDDAQWLDPESLLSIERLMQSFGSRALCALFVQRAGGPAPRAGARRMALTPLRDEEATAIVFARYPAASPAVVAEIVAHAGGHPIDVVALANAALEAGASQSAEIESSARAVIARQLNTLEPRTREFLQLASLISEPIDYRVLAALFADPNELSAIIGSISGRYLIQDGTGLRFMHSSIAESIRYTIPIEIPYRRRILAAMLELEQFTLEDYETLIQQAAACREVSTQRTYLLRLGQLAMTQSAPFAAAYAFERALAIAPPNQDELIAFYLPYALVLSSQDRMSEAKQLLERALREIDQAGIRDGIGPLVALLVASSWRSESIEVALAVVEYYLGVLTEPADRAHVLSMGAVLHSVNVDTASFDRMKHELLGQQSIPAAARMRLNAAEAMLHSRSGNYREAIHSLDLAASAARSLPTAHRFAPELSRLIIDFFEFGTEIMETRSTELLRRNLRDGRNGIIESLGALSLLARGQFDEAQGSIRESLARPWDFGTRRQLLSVSLAIVALTRQAAAGLAEIEQEVRYFIRGRRADSLVPLAAWWAAARAGASTGDVSDVLRALFERLRTPLDPGTPFLPVSLAIAAARANDRAALARICKMDEIWADKTVWDTAHAKLAAGLAKYHAADRSASADLRAAAPLFAQLRAPLFAALSSVYGGENRGEDAALLSALGIADLPKDTNKKAGTAHRASATAELTNRERQVAALVAEGRTNREIAQELVLSERTVEAHLSNLFNKVTVSSRTQLTAWFLTANSSAAYTRNQPL